MTSIVTSHSTSPFDFLHRLSTIPFQIVQRKRPSSGRFGKVEARVKPHRTHRRPDPRPWILAALVLLLGVLDAVGVAASIPYAAKFEDTVDPYWVQHLTPFSDTLAKEKEGAVSLSQLRRRVEKDANLFRTVLRSEGFYAAAVSFAIDQTLDPVAVRFSVKPGPQYLLEEAELVAPNIHPEVLELLEQTVRSSLPPRSPALAAQIEATDAKILEVLAQNGYPLSRIERRRVVVRHDTQTVRTYYRIAAGPQCFFGPVSIEGLKTVSEEMVRPRIPWKEGDLFDSRLLLKAQNTLIHMDLFSVIQLDHAPSADPQGRLPVHITVVERKPRTFKGGLFYSSDVGPELDVSWENRNISAGRAKVAAQAAISSPKKALNGMVLWRDFLRTDQFMQMDGTMVEENWDAYWTRSLDVVASIVRHLNSRVRSGVGSGFRLSNVEQAASRETNALLFFPAYVHKDTTDHPLDATQGFRLHLQTTPYWDITDTSLFFWKTSTTVSTYYDWAGNGRLVLASILAAGSIAGATHEAVPPDLRFYLGGGGSVRGYAYQSLGPRDGNDPTGGLSFVSWNGEVRRRFRERYGLVAFLDGGTVYEKAVPDFRRSFRWASGLGFRYYSPLGPFRIDVAVPLNRRTGIDDAYQIYVSLGQAF